MVRPQYFGDIYLKSALPKSHTTQNALNNMSHPKIQITGSFRDKKVSFLGEPLATFLAKTFKNIQTQQKHITNHKKKYRNPGAQILIMEILIMELACKTCDPLPCYLHSQRLLRIYTQGP